MPMPTRTIFREASTCQGSDKLSLLGHQVSPSAWVETPSHTWARAGESRLGQIWGIYSASCWKGGVPGPGVVRVGEMRGDDLAGLAVAQVGMTTGAATRTPGSAATGGAT